jgi:hypothetical protein
VDVSSPEAGIEVRTKDLQAINVEDVIESVVPLFTTGAAITTPEGNIAAVISAPQTNSPQFRDARVAIRQARRSLRRKVGPALWATVAEVYRDADDHAPEAVAAAFGVSSSTAFRYIRGARDAGLLEKRES